jgi:hypothetical protein
MNLKINKSCRTLSFNAGSPTGFSIVVSVEFPKWLRKLVMKRKGLCAHEHSEYSNYLCALKKGHDGWCCTN